MKPIRITLYKRTDVHTWSPYRVLTAGTWGQAKRKAQEALGPIFPTRDTYRRDMQRAPFAHLQRNPKAKPFCVAPVAHIVPSVGELGYW